MAHLPPVVVCANPPQRLARGVEPATTESGGDLLAYVLRHVVVEPIVADRDGKRHLADVEEVRRIPVRERAHGAHFGDGAVEVRLVTVEAISEREGVDAVERGAAHAQEAFPLLDALAGLRFEAGVRRRADELRACRE